MQNVVVLGKKMSKKWTAGVLDNFLILGSA